MQLGNGIVLASQLLCQQIGIEYPEEGLTLDTASFSTMSTPVATIQEIFIRPEHQLLQLQVDAENLRRKLTLGEALPQVGIGGSAVYGNLVRKYKFNAIALAQVSIPLTQWWETSHKMREHNLRIEEARTMQEDYNKKMSLEEEKAYSDMVDAAMLIRSDSAALGLARENHRLATLNYSAGANTLNDVLQAQTLLLQAQNALTDRRIAYLIARRRLQDLTSQSSPTERSR
jgi:outer membrane protein TolC